MSNSNWRRFVPRQENDFDKKVRQHLDGETPSRNTTFDELPVDKFTEVVNKAAMSNHQKRADAIRKADSYSFGVTHPEFLQTPENIRLLNHQLKTMGLFDNPTYPDFVAAYQSLKDADLLQLDAAELARQEPRSFTGTITKQTFDTVDEMLAAERQAAINKLPQPSEVEQAFENLPQDQALAMLKAGERFEQHKLDAPKSGSNGDAWLTLHPEYHDTERNAKLLQQQLKTNGVLEDVANIAQYEQAYQELRSSGLLSLNPKQIAKQHNEELRQRAADAVAEGGSVFDNTSIDAMEEMDLDEVRRRANLVMGRK